MSRSPLVVLQRTCLCAAAIAGSMMAIPAHAVTTDISGGTSTYRNHLPPTPEIHFIGVYETMSRRFQQHPTGAATVRVAYSAGSPMKPVTLVFSAYEPTVWTLQRDPGAVVEKIVLNGYYPQSIQGASGIPVVGLPNPFGLSYPYQWPHSTGGSDTQRMLVAVENHLGTRVSSFTGAYQASSFTIHGVPAGTVVENPRLGAGNFVNGPNSDLIYDARTGEVKLVFSDLHIAPVPLPPSFRQRLFLSLANHDSSFNVAGFDASDVNSLASFPQEPALNANRLGYNGILLNNSRPPAISLGRLLPAGIPDATQLRQYFAAAHYSTDFRSGEFDLIVIPVPEPNSSIVCVAGMICLAGVRRRFSSRG